jgi:RHS repeat-associated protein
VHRVEYDNATFAAFAYDAFGAMAAKWTVDGTSTRYAYNPTDRRLDRLITELSSGAKIQDVIYSYDPGGNILRHINSISSANPADPEYISDFSYGYDPANRIATFKSEIKDKRAGDKVLPNEKYDYDTLHRMQSTAIDTTGVGTTTRSYQYTDEMTAGVSHPLHAPRLIEEREPAAGPNGEKITHSILHYDDWGNLNRINRTATDGTLIVRRALRWDVENRLVGASIAEREANKPDTTIEADYHYDYSGRRTAKIAPRLGLAGSSDDTVLYANSFFVRRWNQNTASVHVSAGQARIGSVRLTRTQQDTQRYAYLYHSELPNGSVTAVTRPTGVHEFAGELIERLEYKPYGEPIRRAREIGPIASNSSRTSEHLADIGGEGTASAVERSADRRLPFYAYSGKEWDLETGFLYFGARYYDPKIALWLNADPALHRYFEHDVENIHSVRHSPNLAAFQFSSNNPMSYMDPTGAVVELQMHQGWGPFMGTITGTDASNPKRKLEPVGGVFSGGTRIPGLEWVISFTKEERPVPPGKYLIVEYHSKDPRHKDWFRLERIDKTVGDDKMSVDGIERSSVRLHCGGLSYGCVTISRGNEADWERLRGFIAGTKPGKPITDTASIPGRPLTRKTYGTLEVLP